MEAIVRATGDVINVVEDLGLYRGSDGNTYPIESLEFVTETETERFRKNVAAMALQGMLAHSRNGHGYQPRNPDQDWHQAIAEEAVELADCLMKALKIV